MTEQRQRNLERIARLRLMDDDFLSVCMKDNIKGAQLIVRIILGDDRIVVKRVETQKEYKNLSEHSFCFDVYAEDADGRNMEIEVQRKNAGAVPERAACHSGVLDANSIPKNEEDYRKKAETFTIFITEKDVLKGNLPVYHVDRMIKELDNRPFGDRSHIIYVNGAYKGDTSTPLARLVHDLFCTEPDDMHYEELAERARYFKKDGKGVETMCEIWEEILQEGIAKGIAEGIAKGKAEGKAEGIAKGKAEGKAEAIKSLMDRKGWSVEDALDALSIPKVEWDEYKALVRA